MKLKTVVSLAVALMAIPALAFAFGPNMLKKEFSAEEVITIDPSKSPATLPGMDTSQVPRTQIAKVYMAKTMSRFDEGTETTIVRLDRKLVYVVDHKSKTYTVMPMDPNELPAMLKDFDKAVGKKKLGSEKVGGYACTKWQFTIKMDDVLGKELAEQMKQLEAMGGAQAAQMKKYMAQMKKEIVSTVWIADDLGAPIKTVTSDGTTTILRNIKVGSQAASLFAPPKGYVKSDMPGPEGFVPPAPKKGK